MTRAWRLAWRRLRGRCEGCGKRREQHAHACAHCADPRFCHHCGKTRNFAIGYSMNPQRLARLFLGGPQ
jgi:hypothetical protein